MLSENNGVLHIDGISVEKIAEDYGTPCYVMSEDHIRSVCKLYKGAFDKFYEGKATQEDIDRVTDKLGETIGAVYGWEFPTKEKERVSARDAR